MLNTTDYLTPDEAAAILEIRPVSVRALLQRGVLPGQKVGRDWFINRSDLEQYQENRRSPGRPAGTN
jgi:excisionase family DNA binding protein